MAKVLITGASGTIGRVLARGLADHDLTLVDRRRGAGVRRADGRMRGRMRSLLAGSDVVIDLAGDPRPEIGWRTALGNNLFSVVSTLDAAHRAGVPRAIVASSLQVTSGYERDEPWQSVLAGERDGIDREDLPLITVRDPIRPPNQYGAAKAAAEAVGRFYAENHDMTVICIRVGSVTASGEREIRRHDSSFLTHPDLLQLIRCCIEAPSEPRYRLMYGVSDNPWRIWDTGEAEAIGFESTA